jgi:hypothetical protein
MRRLKHDEPKHVGNFIATPTAVASIIAVLAVLLLGLYLAS